MNITAHRSQIRTIKQSDPRFQIKDQFLMAQRAGFEISEDCPSNYLQILQTCINRGWIKPVAHVHERELLFMGLSDE
jgi:hypothetical protein